MDANVTEVDEFWLFLKKMEAGWGATVLLVPCVVVLAAALLHVYALVSGLLSKSCVRNKVVLLSDALSTLGKECASVFHEGGARLILCGKNWEKLQELSNDLMDASDPSMTFPPKLVLLDFGQRELLPDSIKEVLECYGCVDVLILNGNLKVKAPVYMLTLEMDKLLMDNNYFGPVALVKGAHGDVSHKQGGKWVSWCGLFIAGVLPSMTARRSGHLLLVNSIQGKLAVPFRTSYAASKHAVQAFFDCLRSEVDELGICVSTISITFISSRASEKQKGTDAKSFWSYLYTKKPLGISSSKAANEVVKTLSNKRKEVLMAPSLPKVALYARSFFPNVFFAIMAAGVKDSTTTKL
ncbi:dehydrogenase/reductase SDR family member 7C-B-like isoform X1 [Corythoichthys intestinalis]|uniref:dehydrogenase/reductase SDR family member 7C-B-like isoform X1 n=1 Tax=Corythoichthys intestinalis TaxID=161448 RepID=UPI0025A5B2A5|nr:dehydrogenase/reductase SDR family member 7C-B-like isoform X1 [Corythoichthys intestinalis]XP_057717331.1 dehydrogenase/reductase SDR family member 7C-B-like isoform X1 [Corythoichthys intestinalis]